MDDQERIKQVLYGYIRAGLVEMDIDKVLSYIADDVVGIGMGEQGLVHSKQKMKEIMETEGKAEDSVTYDINFEQVEVQIHHERMAFLCARVLITRFCGCEVSKSGLMQSLTLKLQNDQWLICSFHASPIFLSEESIQAYPLKFAENTLAHLKAELQTETLDLMNHSIAGGIISCYIVGESLPLFFANDSMLAYLGFTREEFFNQYSKNVLMVIHPEDRKNVISYVAKSMVNGCDFEARQRFMKKNGDYIYMAARVRRRKDEQENDLLLGVFVDVTEMVELQKELEGRTEALALSEERFRIALEKTSNIVFDYDMISGNIMHSSAPKKSMDFITNIKEVKGTLIIGGEITDDCVEELNKAFYRVQNGEGQSECIVQVKLATGKKVWNKISMTGILDNNGKAVRAIGMIEDITRQKEAEIAYAREEQYRQAILADALASYVINFTKGQFESCSVNVGYCMVMKAGDWYDSSIKSGALARLSEEDRTAFINTFSSVIVLQAFKEGKKEFKLDYKVFNLDGTSMWMQTTLRLVLDAETNEIKGFMYVSDIDKKKHEELEMKHKSERDPMTGLYNKFTLELRIKERLKTVEGLQTGAFMILDIDHFKTINDTYGHPFGDEILIKVARVLKNNFRESDVVGRMGGDEFCIFFSGMSSKTRIEQSAEIVCRNVKNIFIPLDNQPGISCSIGIAMCSGISKSFGKIYKEADEALYEVKKNGRDGFVLYNSRPF